MTYTTTEPQVIAWFHTVNYCVFNNVLTPFEDIYIRDMGDWWACITYYSEEKHPLIDIHLNTEYHDKLHFINILSHEMVHKWQVEIIQDTGNHNKHFFSWRSTFAKHGLSLNRKG